MAASFLFYDLETTGISAANDRIMQFAGIRTDLDLNPIGQPTNIHLSLTEDILPAPEAILISGLSPLRKEAQVSEAQFGQLFNSQLVQAETIFVGFNNVRFDDEFIRYLNYRNFYDPYGWHWRNNCSRWDLLDVVRITRALRPEGINWPFSDDNKPSNKLGLLAQANKLKHASAHEALSDTEATIAVANLLKSKQPKLFQYLLSLRKKPNLIKLIENSVKLVYCSSHYSSDYLHTTVVTILALDLKAGSALVYDLRRSPVEYLNKSVDELVELWQYDPDSRENRLPVKTVRLNRCPAIAPFSVLDEESTKRLALNLDQIESNYQLLIKNKQQFRDKVRQAAKKLDQNREIRRSILPPPLAEQRLYERFIEERDQSLFGQARSKAKQISDYQVDFSDSRLEQLYGLYRARNYPEALTSEELQGWHKYVADKLFGGSPSQYEEYGSKIDELTKTLASQPDKLKLLNDLKDYGQSILKTNFPV